MVRLMVVVLALVSGTVFAKSEVALELPLKLSGKGFVQGSLEGLLPDDLSGDGLHLLGHASTKLNKHGQSVTTVTWFGVEKKKRFGSREVVSLEKPGVFAFQVEDDVHVLPKSQNIGLNTDKKTIEKGISSLLIQPIQLY